MKKLKQTLKEINWSKVKQWVIVAGIILMPVIALVPQVTHGQSIGIFSNNCPAGTGVRCSERSVAEVFRLILNWGMAIVFILAVLYLIYGGFKYVLSAGNEDEVKAARGTIFNALIGMAIVALSYMVVQIVYRFITGSGSGAFS